MKRFLAILLVMVLCLTLLAGCGKTNEPAPSETTTPTETTKPAETSKPAETEKPAETTPAEPEEPQYLKLGLSLNDNLSGLRSTYINGNLLQFRMLFSSLLVYEPDTGEYLPCLADTWTVSPDGKEYTVTLGDHKFHDGTPITADDVVFTYSMAIRANANNVAKLSLVDGYAAAKDGTADTVPGIQKVDEKTVKFVLTAPDSLFMTALANGYFSILPAAYFEGMTPTEVKETPEFWKTPVGSGPYMISETNYPSYITLTRFEDYHEPAGVKDVLLTYYTDASAGEAAWIAGEVDIGYNTSYDSAVSVTSGNPDVESLVVPSLYGRFLRVNYSGTAGDGESHPSLSNVKVRHALNMLLDKESVAILYNQELSAPLTTRVNPSSPNYNTDIPLWKRDVEGAKKILDEEGFRYDIPLRFYSHYEDQVTADLFELFKQNLAEVGIEMTYVMDKNHQPIAAVTDYDIRLEAGMFPNVVETYQKHLIDYYGTPEKSHTPVADPDF